MKIAVIVGRFQVPEPHAGHLALISAATAASDHVILMLGVAPFRSIENPLSFTYREEIIRRRFNVSVFPIFDVESHIEWSSNLDTFLKKLHPFDEITLWHGRDGFVNYTGTFKKVEYSDGNVVACSATTIRDGIIKTPHVNTEWAAGIIHAIGTEYPRPQMAVDIAVLDTRQQVLLGRKKGEPYWRFPGGMVDPTDYSLEDAVKRETWEETGLTILFPTYLGSFRMGDWRTIGTKQAIFSAFFMSRDYKGPSMAGDDLHELRWFTLEEAKKSIGAVHTILFLRLANVLQ